MNTGVTGIIFRRALRDSRRAIVGWGLGLAGMGLMMFTVFPDIEDLLGMFGDMMENPFIKSLVGDVEQFATLEGFLDIKFFAMMPLILAVYAVMFALGIVAGEEESGTLDILLSTPSPRWQIIVEKYAALIVAVVLILTIGLAGLLIGDAMLTGHNVPLGRMIEAVVNILPITLLFASLALLLSTLLRSRATAGAVAAAIIFTSYFMTTLGDMIDGALGNIKYLSVFQYYDGANILVNGITWPGFIGLLLGAAALLGLSIVFFQRRDLLG